ncbi:MAG TPA: metal/formaldehyde-sensitive transcriptional repressor [Kaistia sp.]|nr:metal/formaldehyde-sensitive transcriptional repressor [Kaistia sp.]
MSHLSSNKDPLLARIRRIAGQIAAVERAVAGDAGCAAVLHQVAGVRGALDGLMDELIADHVREHVAKPGLDDAARTAGADELITVIRRHAR